MPLIFWLGVICALCGHLVSLSPHASLFGSVFVLLCHLSVLLHILQSVRALFIVNDVAWSRYWRPNGAEEGSSCLLWVVEWGWGFAVATRWFLGSVHCNVHVLLISKLNGCFRNTYIMSIAVSHAWMKAQSGCASIWISSATSVVTSTTPTDLGGIVACLSMCISRGAFCTCTSTVSVSIMSPFCLYCFYMHSVLHTTAIIGAGVEVYSKISCSGGKIMLINLSMKNNCRKIGIARFLTTSSTTRIRASPAL